jgi:uncharacterized membrane protein YphA (DoxX/SURF4 family)
MMTVVMYATMLERLIMGAFILYVGWIKIRHGPNRLLESILGYDLIPHGVAVIVARWLPWVEILSGLMLIVGFMSQLAALLVFGLFLLYTAAITASLIRGKNNDCGCFASLTPVQWRLVYRNIILMALLLPVYVFDGGVREIGEWIARPAVQFFSDGATGLVIVWGTVLTGALVLHKFFHKPAVRV